MGFPGLPFWFRLIRVRLYGIARGDMTKILNDYPKLVPNVVKVLTERIRHLLELIEELSLELRKL